MIDISAFEANYQPYRLPSQQQQGKRKGRGGSATSFISEGGALGGAAAGAAVGSVVPIVGTAIGGLLGAGIGAFGGRLAENKVRDDEYRVKDALVEGGLTAALGGIAPGYKALKGARAAKAGLAGGVERNSLDRSARSALGNAWGIRSGEKINGRLITPQRAEDLQRFVIDEVKVPKTANADRVFEAITDFQGVTGKNIGDLVGGSTAKINKTALNQSMSKSFGSIIGADAKNNPVAKDILAQVRAAKTPADLWQVRRNIDDQLISFTRNENAATPGAEAIARAARKEINGVLKGAIPEYGAMSKSFSRASDVAELAAKGAKTPRGARLPGFLGGVAGPQVQSARAALGQSTLKAGDAMRGIGQAPMTARGAAKKAVMPSLAESLVNPPAPIDQEPAQLDGELEQDLMGAEHLGVAGEQLEPQGSDSPFDPANVEANVEQIMANGGDLKDVKEYLGLVEALQGIRAAGGGGAQKPLSAEAAKVVSNAQIGIRALDDFSAALEKDPSVAAKRVIPGRGLLGGVLGGALGTTSADAAANQIVDVIARLRTGAAITNDEARRFQTFIPVAGDPPETRRQKINYLKSQFEMVANRSGSAGTDLQSALMQ